MAQRALEQRVENLEHRVATVEQILPTLATKADLQAAIAPLATRAEVKTESEQTRRYFDVVADGLRADMRLLVDGQTATNARLDAMHSDITRILERHDKRLIRLEAAQKRR